MNTMKITDRNKERRIKDFLAEMGEGDWWVEIRDPAIRLNSKKYGVPAREIRSKKNDIVASYVDMLGNTIALHADGYHRLHEGS
jgi:hypothetical protein